MGAEDAAVGVNLVQDDKRQVFEQPFPVLMMGQKSPVEHVRIGKNDFRDPGPDLFSLVGGRVPIVDAGRDLLLFDPLQENGKGF